MEKYILIAEKGQREKTHDSFASASQEARRLCDKERCKIFIYKAIGETKIKEVPIEYVPYKEDFNE